MEIERLEPFLRTCSCFALLSDDELRIVRDRAELRLFKLGQVIFRQGEVGDRMYLVYSGKVRILREEAGQEIPLNTLFAGEHFGEMALVTKAKRSATVRSAADSTLISIPAEAVELLLSRNDGLRRYFESYGDRVELWNFIKLVGEIGTKLKPPQVRQLVDRFVAKEYPAGTSIVTEGEVPDRFHLIQSGRVKAIRDGKLVTTMTGGDTFGGTALVETPPAPNRFTLETDGPVRTLSLSAEDFRTFLSSAPEVRKSFEERAAHLRTDDTLRAASQDAASRRAGGLQDDAGEMSVRVRSMGDLAEGETAAGPGVAEGLTSGTDPVRGVHATYDPTVSATEFPIGQSNGSGAAELATVDEVAPIERDATKPVAAQPMGFWQRWWFSYIPQHEEIDCGAACLAMITSHYKRPVGVGRLRDLAGVSTSGASLAQLASAAEEIGYQSRSLRISAERIDNLKLPAIVFWKGYHYIVLYALSPTHVWVADPAIGKVKMTRAEFAESYSGFAMEVEPTEAAAAIRPKSHATQRLIQLLLQNKKVLATILGTSLLLDLFGLAPALFTKKIMDDVVTPDGEMSTLNLVALAMVLVSLMQIAMSVFRALVSARLSQYLDRNMLQAFFGHLLKLPIRFFKLRRTGDIVARFGDNHQVRDLFTQSTMSTLLDLMMVFIYFAVMFYWNVPLTLVVMAFVPLFAGLTLFISPYMKAVYRRLMEEEAMHEANLIESIGGMDMVKAMAVEDRIQQRWQDLFERYLKTQYRSQKMEQMFGSVGGALGILSTVALLWYGASLVLRGELTVGEFMAFNMLAGQVTGPLGRIIGLWDEVQQARVALERLSDVFDNDPEWQPPEAERVYPQSIRGRVKFDGVSFQYGGKGSAYVLKNVSFEAAPGERIAIVGQSGSGKTTLARLLLGIYRPTEGNITIDEWDLKRIDLATYRHQAGFVLQENLLFSGTILDNIALGDGKPDRERAEEAAAMAGAHEFIKRTPLGYGTVVGEFGLTLSGGQRQRISIARALYRDPRILVLDEATSALDSISEREIQKNFETILSDRTSFIIAHKIATVRNADRILVLHEGALVEKGTHDELIARRGTYYHLAAQQLNL